MMGAAGKMSGKYDPLSTEGNKLFGYFIQQCKNPTGFIGSKMTNIWNRTFRSMTDWGLRRIEFTAHERILDIGCGGGATIKELVSLNANAEKIYGIDISKVSVKNSRKVNKLFIEQKKVEILKSAVEKMPFPENYFDRIFAVQTHIYWNDMNLALCEIERVLKPDGRLHIICEKDKITYHLKDYENTEKMCGVLKDAGLKDIVCLKEGNWIAYTGRK